MIEQTILNYLNTILDVPVLMELPEVPSEDFPNWPDQFVVIERVGGGKTNHVNQASFALQSYSMLSLYNAAALDDDVKTAMDNIIELPEIGGAKMASNYNHTDTRTKRYRYQCVYDIYFV